MLFGKKSRYKENLERFNFYANELIKKANEKYNMTPDCTEYLMPSFNRVISNSKEEIESWDASTDVCSLAYKVLFNLAFDELSSGKLHLYYGKLNPMGPGNKLLFIVNECLTYFVKNGYITKEEKRQQQDLLQENISTVG